MNGCFEVNGITFGKETFEGEWLMGTDYVVGTDYVDGKVTEIKITDDEWKTLMNVYRVEEDDLDNGILGHDYWYEEVNAWVYRKVLRHLDELRNKKGMFSEIENKTTETKEGLVK